MYPSSINRALCSDGMRCIKPLAPSRKETNSSRVNIGADAVILEYAPQAPGGQETSPSYTCQPSGFVFYTGRCRTAFRAKSTSGLLWVMGDSVGWRPMVQGAGSFGRIVARPEVSIQAVHRAPR